MSISHPIHSSRQAVLRCLPQDAAAVARRLHDTPVEREIPGSSADSRLDDIIRKPWGVEFRIYDDALIDVWMLHLRAGARTSMHCHPRKDTMLLCVSGLGDVTIGDGSVTHLRDGDVMRIEQGAAHRSTATTAMTLVEIETPRDKYDLVRLQDDSGRAARGYDRIHEPHPVPIEDVRGGPPRARLRPRCERRGHRFALERGRDVIHGPRGLTFAVCLDPLDVLRRDIAISHRRDLGGVRVDQTYLTIYANPTSTT